MTDEILSNFIPRPRQLDYITGTGYNFHLGYTFHKRLN